MSRPPASATETRRSPAWLVPAIVGVVSGIAGSLVLSRPPASSSAVEPVVTSSRVDARQARADGREPRYVPVAPSPNKQGRPAPSVGAAEPQKPEASEGEDPVERHQALIAKHQASPVDRPWSRAASASLRRDLDALGPGSRFKTVAVDCRSTSCAATVEWSDYGTAVGNWGTLLHANYETNCARQIVLPEPEQAHGSDTYRATIVFTCEGEHQ